MCQLERRFQPAPPRLAVLHRHARLRASPVQAPAIRGLHSSTSQLNLNIFLGI
jgi:hypothetical protein